jgi:hypothetical protein
MGTGGYSEENFLQEQIKYVYIKGCFLKFGVEVGVEDSIVNALGIRITDHGSAV